ncbi:MAG TPA: hypothetical protein VFM10_07670 [Terriglobales bacterium]|nr:hypothetical protein [Terriglobales bacterium]
MGIDEIDLTIYPYTVGREDCKVLPRSFKTLAEAEAYLAEQNEDARGDFYLDGPEQDNASSDSCGPLVSHPEVVAIVTPVTERGEPDEPDSECTPMAIESQTTLGAWKREIDELCRALEGTEAD